MKEWMEWNVGKDGHHNSLGIGQQDHPALESASVDGKFQNQRCVPIVGKGGATLFEVPYLKPTNRMLSKAPKKGHGCSGFLNVTEVLMKVQANCF
jgi:hypothetical protein